MNRIQIIINEIFLHMHFNLTDLEIFECTKFDTDKYDDAAKNAFFFSSHKQFRQKSKQHKIQRTQRYSIYGLNESNLQSQMRENSACRSLKRSFKVYAF